MYVVFIYLFLFFCQYSLQFCCEYLLWYAPWLMSESCFNCILCCCKRQQVFFNTLWHIVQKNPKRICQVYCTSKSPRRCHFLWRDTWHQLTVTVTSFFENEYFPQFCVRLVFRLLFLHSLSTLPYPLCLFLYLNNLWLRSHSTCGASVRVQNKVFLARNLDRQNKSHRVLRKHWFGCFELKSHFPTIMHRHPQSHPRHHFKALLKD